MIDLAKNELKIGTTGTVTTFLSEAELPEHARLNQPPNEDQDLAEAMNKSAQEAGNMIIEKCTEATQKAQKIT